MIRRPLPGGRQVAGDRTVRGLQTTAWVVEELVYTMLVIAWLGRLVNIGSMFCWSELRKNLFVPPR